MATLTVQDVTRSGLNITYSSAAGGGDAFANSGLELIHIRNNDASGMTLTVAVTKQVDGLAVTDRTVSIPAGEERLIGPFPVGEYNDGDGLVQLTYSSVTSLTLGIVKVIP